MESLMQIFCSPIILFGPTATKRSMHSLSVIHVSKAQHTCNFQDYAATQSYQLV
eukprot:c5649_g1_i1 orf=200-361(+)